MSQEEAQVLLHAETAILLVETQELQEEHRLPVRRQYPLIQEDRVLQIHNRHSVRQATEERRRIYPEPIQLLREVLQIQDQSITVLTEHIRQVTAIQE